MKRLVCSSVAFLLGAVCLFACKHQDPVDQVASAVPTAQAKAPAVSSAQDAYHASAQAVTQHPPTLSLVMADLQKDIAAYQQTSSYKSPQSDDEKSFNEVVDYAALFAKWTPAQVTALFKEGRFASVQARLANMPAIQQQAQQLLLADNTPAPPSKAAVGLVDQTALQDTVGSVLIAVGAFGFMGRFLVPGLGRYEAVATLSQLASLAPMFVGLLLVCPYPPNRETINAAKDLLYVGAAISAANALYYGFSSSQMTPKPGSKTYLTEHAKKQMKFGAAVFFTLLTASVAVAASYLQLDSGVVYDSRPLVASQVARAFYALVGLEQQYWASQPTPAPGSPK